MITSIYSCTFPLPWTLLQLFVLGNIYSSYDNYLNLVFTCSLLFIKYFSFYFVEKIITKLFSFAYHYTYIH